MHTKNQFALNCKGKQLDLSQPKIMGILNVTPDSFSDGGRFVNPEQAIIRAEQMIQQGADILDIGGESTRPGAEEVSEQQELDRVIPLIEMLKDLPPPISVDTRKAKVMQEAIAAGACMINDVNALNCATTRQVAAQLDVPVCLMHMQGKPETMQSEPHYDDVFGEVSSFLSQQAQAAQAAGVKSSNIILDPGFGFGKTLAHNVALFKQLPKLVSLGYPILVGLSRKRMLGAITGKDVAERMPASICSGLLAIQNGASILRVHDVAETKDMLRILETLTINLS